MSLRSALFCLAVTTFCLVTETARAHFGFGDDFECVDSYEQGCTLGGAANSRRTLRAFFDGTNEENGVRCEKRTAQLQTDLATAETSLGFPAGSIKILESRKFANRCSYVISSNRRDLRFTIHHVETRKFFFGVDPELCAQDARVAKAVPNAIGAGNWISSDSIVSICETHYALAGLDHVETDANGTTILVKYGARR